MSKKQNTVQTLISQLAKPTLAMGLIAAATGLQAQDSITTYNLDAVTITATRVEQNPDTVGRSVTVIKKEAINNSVYNNVAELLSTQEGIYVVGAAQNPGSVQSVFMRGANSEHTVILVDGVRITDPSSTTNSVNLAELSLVNIEQIEIVRGSHSTLYGSSAIGGVINIITKKGTKKGVNLSANATVGLFNETASDLSQNVNLGYTAKNGLYVNGEVFNRNVAGIDATTDTITNPNTYNKRDKDGFEKLDLVGKVGFKNKKWNAFVAYKNTNQLSEIDDGAYIDDDNYTVEFDRNLYSYQAAYKLGDKANLTFVGGYTDMKRTAFDDSSVVSNLGTFDHAISESSYEGTVLNNELQADFKTKNAAFIFGAGHYEQTMTAKTFYKNYSTSYESKSDLDTLNIKTNTSSLFAHSDINGNAVSASLNKLNLGLGLRYNYHSTFGNNITYELNPTYKLSNNSVVYLSYSTGFNAPALYRLYSPNKNMVSNITRGNIDLDPEKSASIELGVKQRTGKNTFITFAMYQTTVKDLIDYVYLWDKSIGIDTLGNDWMRPDYLGDTYLNIGTQTNTGFEFGLQTQLNKQFSLAANISLVSGKLNYKPSSTSYTNNYHVQLFESGTFLTEEVEMQGLTRRSNTVNINLGYTPTKKLAFNADLRFAGLKNDVAYDANLGPYGALGQTKVGGYSLLGFNVKYTFVKKLTVNFRIDNLADVDYQEINGYTTRGRGFYLKLNYSL